MVKAGQSIEAEETRGEADEGKPLPGRSAALDHVGPWEPYYLGQEIRLVRAHRGLIVDIPLSEISDVDKEGSKVVMGIVDKKKPIWPFPAANERIDSMAEMDDPQLMADMVRFIKERVLFLNDDEYYALAAWIIATYLKPFFSKAPRWYLFGGRGSGKSTCQHWIRLTAYRGIKTVNMTPAVFFRIMDKYSPTMIREESQDDKGELAEAVDQVEKAGYDDDNHLYRCNPNDPSLIDSFDPFGYLVRSYRGERPKNDTLSRGLCVVMVNKPESVQLKDWDDGYDEAGVLRARLLAFQLRALTGKVDISVFRESAKKAAAERFRNRALDVAVPILAAALAFGRDEHVLITAKRTLTALNDSTATEPEALVFHAVRRIYDRQPVRYAKGTFEVDGTVRTFDHRDISKITTNDVIREYNQWLEEEAISSGTAEIARWRKKDDRGTGETVEVPEYRVPKVPGQRITNVIKDLGFSLSEDRKKGGKRGFDEASFFTIYGRLLERYDAARG